MTTNQITTIHSHAIRRFVAGVILCAATPLFAIGAATAAHADTTVCTPGPSFHAPAHHQVFPLQTDVPSPGTPAHHHHEHHYHRRG